MAIQPDQNVNEVFDITPPYPDAPGILAGFLFDNVALTLAEQGPVVMERTVLQVRAVLHWGGHAVLGPLRAPAGWGCAAAGVAGWPGWAARGFPDARRGSCVCLRVGSACPAGSHCLLAW